MRLNSSQVAILSHVRGIFFDLDDTLCGYWDASKAAMRTAFESHPVADQTPEQMLNHWGVAFRKFSPTVKDANWYAEYCKAGEKTRTEQMRLTLAELGIVDEDIAQALSATYADQRNKNLRLFPDALALLDELFHLYPLGLMTNGPADIQRQEVSTLGIGHFFDPIIIEGEMMIGKPHREVFEFAEQAHNLPPEQLLFVGNSYGHDVRPALEFGWSAVWIRRPSDIAPSRNEPEKKPEDGPEPTSIIGNLSDLRPLLGL